MKNNIFKKIRLLFLFIMFISLISACAKKPDYQKIRARLQELKNTQSTDDAQLKKNIDEYEEITSVMLTAFEGKFAALRFLGINCIQKEMFDLAIEYLSKALAIKPDDGDSRYYLGVAYSYKGKRDKTFSYKAEEEFKSALLIQPENSIILYSLSILYYYQLDKTKEALEIMKRAADKSTTAEYKPLTMLGKYYYNSGEYGEALGYFKQSLEKISGADIKARIALNISHIYLKMNDSANADIFKNKAREYNPKINLEKIMETIE